jgi:type I restriction enzyme, S subunit
MSEMVFSSLTNFADVTMGQSPDSGICNTDGSGLPFLQGSAEFGAKYPEASIFCNPPLRIAKVGTVLISVRAPVGAMNYANRDYCIGRGLGAFKAKEGLSNIVFLKHAVEFNAGFLHSRSQGSTFSAISSSDLQSVPIPRFNKNTQNEIARIFSTIDQAIEKTEELIEKYEQIKAGLMHDLFTRGIGVDGKLRPPFELAPELYQQTPIGWIPKDWNIKFLHEVSDVIDPQPDHRTPPEDVDGIPYIGIGDFEFFGDIDFQYARKVIQIAFAKQRLRFIPRDGDIIFGKIGTIGKPKSLKEGEYALSANVVLIQPNIASSYLRHCLDSIIFLKQVSDITNTTSQPALGIEKVRQIKIPLPNTNSEMNCIFQFIDNIDHKINKESKFLFKTNQQKSGLMHDLLTGKVQVSINSTEAAHV